MIYFQIAVFVWMLAVSVLDVESSAASQSLPGVVEANSIIVSLFGKKPTRAQFWIFKVAAVAIMTALNVGLAHYTAWQAGLPIPVAWTGMTIFWTHSNVDLIPSGNRTWWMKVLA